MSDAAPIQYGQPGDAADNFGHGRTSVQPMAAVLAALRQQIEAAGLWVLHEIDPQAILARAGHSIGAARQILFFHPDLMVRLLQADPAALLEVPLKFAVMALPDGTVSIRWIDPAIAFVRYGNAPLAELGRELAATVDQIATKALGDPAG